MKREELQKIIDYVNDIIKDTISTDDSETNDLIEHGFFTEEEFINHYIVEIDR